MSEQLTEAQADALYAEMMQLENDPMVTKHQMRLFMQSSMPCGHSMGNLLTCPDPPFGCVRCNQTAAQDELAAWLPVAMTFPNWIAHLRWSGGGLLFRDLSWGGLERLHLVAYDEVGREQLVRDLTPVAEQLAGDGLVAIERYRTDDDWHAWIFFKHREAA